MQLDILDDSHDVALRNAVIEALLRDSAADAGAAVQALRAAFPADWCLAPAARLVQALDAEAGAAPFDAAGVPARPARHPRGLFRSYMRRR